MSIIFLINIIIYFVVFFAFFFLSPSLLGMFSMVMSTQAFGITFDSDFMYYNENGRNQIRAQEVGRMKWMGQQHIKQHSTQAQQSEMPLLGL